MIVKNNTLFENSNAVFLFKNDNAISELKDLRRISLQFDRVASEIFSLNLQMVDSKLPQLMATVLYYSFKTGISTWMDIISALNHVNPLRINTKSGVFYKSKISEFLINIALGLNSTTIYQGTNSDPFFIYIDKFDTIKYHHIYDRNLLIDFLLYRTQLSNIVTSTDWTYEENENYYVKFNLRIKIIQSIS